MNATPPDPLATQHDGTTDPDNQAPVDAQTLHLREENRALRELLAAQVHAALPQQQPGWIRRLGWWLISAPGAALVSWRSLFGSDQAMPITRRRMGYATLTVLYTLAIYGALVLLVVYWSTPNGGRAGATAASPVRVPLKPLPPLPSDVDPSQDRRASPPALADANIPERESAPSSTPAAVAAPSASAEAASLTSADAVRPTSAEAASSTSSKAASSTSSEAAPPASAEAAAVMIPVANEAPAASTSPQPVLRITEIPAPNPLAWVDALKGELERCAELGFFERPDCAWNARKQFCEPNHGWGTVKDCPVQP